jgi:hypothetical protein
MADKEIGFFARSQGQRWWVGGCTCGSGLDGHELYDARGIYCGITCRQCKREDTYRKEVMTDPNYYVDEPIEPEDY